MKLMRIIRSNLKSVIMVCFLVTTAVCANTEWYWSQAASFGGSGNDAARAIKVGSDGSQYFTGQFGDSIQFGNTLLTSNGGLDIFLTKVDPSGTVLWAIQAGGSDDDWGINLALDGSDNIYITGMFYNSATFDSTDGSTIPVTGNGYTIFLAKYNLSGVVAWVQTGTIPTSGDYNWGQGVAIDPTSGVVYLAGISQGNTTFSSADGKSHTVPGNGAWHMFLAKYDTNGKFHWGEANAANINSAGYSVAVDKEDNAYVIGWLEDQTTFYSRNGKNITITGFSPAQRDGNYPSDAYLVKYDSAGNAKWANHIGGYVDQAFAVAVGPSGEVSLVGYVGNINYDLPVEKTATVTSQPPGKNMNLGGGDYTNPYNWDAVIASWDGRGVLKKAVRIGGPKNEMATWLTYDANGLLYVSGTFQSPFDIGSRHLYGNNKQNLFVLQYSGKSLRRAATAVNATVGPSAPWTGLSVDSGGDVFVVGTYQDTARFGDFTLSGGGLDMFLAELALH
jgi:hypothetical protein